MAVSLQIFKFPLNTIKLHFTQQNYALQLLHDLDVSSTRFLWILPPLEVDPVRKDGVGIKDKVDGVVVVSFD